MLRRALMIFLLPLLFLLAQQGSVTHEISHLSEQTPLNQQKQQTPHSPVCSKCIGFSHMGNAISAGDFSPPLILASFDYLTTTSNDHFLSKPAFYAARAPPQAS